MRRRAFLGAAAALSCGGGADVGAVFSKGGFTPSLINGFWWANDDVSAPTPPTLVDRMGGFTMTPVGATGGTLETTGWGGQQKSVLQNATAWKCTDAGVVSKLTGGQNFWLCFVAMQLGTLAGKMPDQTFLSAGSSVDAQKYLALQGRKNVSSTIGGFPYGSQRWIQRFGVGAETHDESTQPQGPFPYIWFLQVDGAGLHTFDRNGLNEQTFTRGTGGALSVDTLVIGALIQGGVITPDGILRWRHLMGNSGVLSAGNITNLYTWLNNDSRGFSKKRGIVGPWTTKTSIQFTEWGQSNDEDQSVAVALTAGNCWMMPYNNFTTALAAPWCSSTGTPFTAVFAGSNGNGIGGPNAFANQMVALGKFNPATQALFFVPGGVGGSSMGSFWCKNLLTDPWGWDTPVGAQCLRLEDTYRDSPNPEVLPSPDYQGESDTLSFAQADGWDDANRAPAVAGAYVTWVAARGYVRKPATPERAICILPVDNWTSATLLNWTTQRNAANAAAVGIPNSVAIQVDTGDWIGGPGGNRLHIGTTAQTARYQAIAAIS